MSLSFERVSFVSRELIESAAAEAGPGSVAAESCWRALGAVKKGWSFLGSAASVLLAMASTVTEPI